MGPGVTLAEGGSFYVGVTATGERLDVLYEKAVDNTDPSNIAANQGRVFRSDDSAARAAFGVGFLGGYRMSLGPTGVYLSAEGDTAYHAGTVRGILPGVGASEGRNQLGENWREDWSFDVTTQLPCFLSSGFSGESGDEGQLRRVFPTEPAVGLGLVGSGVTRRPPVRGRAARAARGGSRAGGCRAGR